MYVQLKRLAGVELIRMRSLRTAEEEGSPLHRGATSGRGGLHGRKIGSARGGESAPRRKTRNRVWRDSRVRCSWLFDPFLFSLARRFPVLKRRRRCPLKRLPRPLGELLWETDVTSGKSTPKTSVSDGQFRWMLWIRCRYPVRDSSQTM